MTTFLMIKASAQCARGARQALMMILSVLLISSMFTTVAAQPASEAVQATQEAQAAPGPVNQQQALERVRARFPGNVIAINEVRQGNRVRYRIRLDNEGNIYTVFVDQATGAISRE